MNRRSIIGSLLAFAAGLLPPRKSAARSIAPAVVPELLHPEDYPFALPHEQCGGMAFFLAERPLPGSYLTARGVMVKTSHGFHHPNPVDPILCSHCGGRIPQPQSRNVIDLREILT